MKTKPSHRLKGVFTLLCLLSASVIFSGCMNSSSGTPIDSAKVERIQKGKTTRAEVEALLGKPEMAVMMGDGKRCLSYVYSATKMSVVPSPGMLIGIGSARGATRSQTLQVFVGKDGVVEDYELSDTTRDIKGNGLSVQSTAR